MKGHTLYKRVVQVPAIFLDRDGTLNVEVPIVNKPENLILIEGAAQAVKRINQSGRLAILLTNQAIIARNQTTPQTLHQIHLKLRRALQTKGAHLDAIYYCPHHPDYGPPCNCRKPKTGLLKAAQQDFDIDLTKSWLIGDSAKDIELARNAGVRSILLKTGKAGADLTNVFPDRICETLNQAVDSIL